MRLSPSITRVAPGGNAGYLEGVLQFWGEMQGTPTPTLPRADAGEGEEACARAGMFFFFPPARGGD